MADDIKCLNTDCPVENFPPSWVNTSINTKTRSREGNERAGIIHATTCFSCGHLHLGLTTDREGTPPMVEEQVIFPVPDEAAIEVTVLIMVEFVDRQQRERGEEPLSDEEKDHRKATFRDLFRGMRDAAKGATTVNAVLDLAQKAAPLLPFLPSG